MIFASVVRFFELSAIAAVLGALALDTLVLSADAESLASARRRLRRWTSATVVVLALATIAGLVARAQTMSQGDLGTAVRAIPLVLTRTHYGAIWIARAAAIVVLFVLSLVGARAARVSALAMTVGVALSIALTGHAADWGDVRPTVAIDWIHIVASGLWTGGLIALAAIVLTEHRSWPHEVFRDVCVRFSTLAGVCLALVVLSGAYASIVQIATPSALWLTAYGRTLLIKVFVVGVLVALGAMNRYGVVATLRESGGREGPMARFARRVLGDGASARDAPLRLSRYVGREAMLALVVFACTGVLGELTPGRHARHLFHHEHHQEGQHDHMTAPERDSH
jgi:putative copper export protein